MAALLKKRALAEYTQSQTVVEAPAEPTKPKKLRLVKKAEDAGVVSTFISESAALLDVNRTPEENFKVLSSIAVCLPPGDAIVSSLYQKLIHLLHSSDHSALKAKCLSVLQLLCTTKSTAIAAVEEICRALRKETSKIVLVAGLTAALKLAQISENFTCEANVIVLAKTLISKSDGQLKNKCLEAVGSLASNNEGSNLNDLMSFARCFTHSGDPRVRSTAFRIMLQLHKKGANLEHTVYHEILHCLNDDYDIVKLAALQLIFAISKVHPEMNVPREGVSMRLIDDAFARICAAINDPCLQVRVLAAQLLGKMTEVGPVFLEQTLDKKLMSDMRRKRSAHERKWEKVKAGEWSSGKQWADDSPKELVDAESVSLISGGAAGAFIHGLEDEFMEVRSASVDSLCQLAMLHKGFANTALDFLVDMFNDEIEDVRLKAIDSLCRISSHIILWEDHLDIILSVVEDSSMEIREALHRVLSVSHMMTKDCVKMCVQSLLENLRRHPGDKLSIWNALQGIGERHSWAVLPLVPQLLSMHSFFDTAETEPEDPVYASVLILVFNAAKNCPPMLSLFEEKFQRHYQYLRDNLPQLVPELSLGQEPSAMVDTATESEENGGVESETPKFTGLNGKSVLQNLIDKLKQTKNMSASARLSLNKLVLRDVKRLSEVDQEVSGVAKLTALFIRAHIVYTHHILESGSWKQLSQNSQNDFLKVQIQKLLQLCLKMQYGFSGLNPQEFAVILQLKLRALVFQLVYIVKGSNASALAVCQNLLEQGEVVQTYLTTHNVKPDTFTSTVFQILESVEEPKPGTLSNLLMPVLEAHSFPFVHFNSSVKETVGTVIEPTGESDTPSEFTSGLVLGVPFHCQLRNLQLQNLIRIRVKYPDEQEHMIRPKPDDFKPLLESPEVIRLVTTVTVSHKSWTEPCPVVFSVVLDLSGPETNYNRKLVVKNDSTYTLQLSEEKQVLVAPRPPRRGI